MPPQSSAALAAIAAPEAPPAGTRVRSRTTPTTSETSGPAEDRAGADPASSALENTEMAAKPTALGNSSRNGATEAWYALPNGGEDDRAEDAHRPLGTLGIGAARDRRQQRGGDRSRQQVEHLRRVDRDGVDAQRRLRGDNADDDLVDAGVEQVRQSADPGLQPEGHRLPQQPAIGPRQAGIAHAHDPQKSGRHRLREHPRAERGGDGQAPATPLDGEEPGVQPRCHRDDPGEAAKAAAALQERCGSPVTGDGDDARREQRQLGLADARGPHVRKQYQRDNGDTSAAHSRGKRDQREVGQHLRACRGARRGQDLAGLAGAEQRDARGDERGNRDECNRPAARRSERARQQQHRREPARVRGDLGAQHAHGVAGHAAPVARHGPGHAAVRVLAATRLESELAWTPSS